mmetsp:Transcript_17610/g.29670  ORF Transcript_17610/g.29670 Transcript_17610/m.29670 type:complete len:336 (+) Transcript_17610:144-1151(+)
MSLMLPLWLSLTVYVLLTFQTRSAECRRLTEPERVAYWHERNNTWPPNWQPETEQYREFIAEREKELQMIPGADERWENYMQFTAARMVPRFTETGFMLIQTPPDVQAKLKKAVDDALANWDNVRNESVIDVLYTPIQSKFVDVPKLKTEVTNTLLPLHEEWSGLKLKPTSIYGIRMNRAGASLVMHYDKIMTHVISSIIHIDHKYFNNDEPWSIEIEDHTGQLHAVNLEPGQMLFYESAACLHGRRQILKGEWYASIFNHYQPVDPNIWSFTIDDVINNVPPHWKDGIIEDHGNRHAGQGLTIDSRVCDAAPPRVIKGQVVENIAEYYAANRDL